MNPLIHFNDTEARVQAKNHVGNGRVIELQSLAEQALQDLPEQPDWLGLLAYALSMQQKPEQALVLHEKLTQLQPQVAQHWCNLGNSLCELGQELEALSPLQKAYELGARNGPVFFALARAQAAHGELNLALKNIDQAVKLDPKDAEFRILRARLLTSLDQWSAANDEMDALLTQDLSAEQKIELGYLLLRSGFYQDALRAFEESNPDELNVDSALGRILTLERLNRIEEANKLRAMLSVLIVNLEDQTLLDKVWQVDAKLAGRRKDFVATRDLLEKIVFNPDQDKFLAASLKFDLAAAYDKCGQTNAAMKVLADAHAYRRGFVNQHHPALTSQASLLAVLEQAPTALPKLKEKSGNLDGNQDPVFVVGFPRSGTTLLEQLLDAHIGLISFDEQPFLQHRLQVLIGKYQRLDIAFSKLDFNEINSMRSAYFEDVGKVAKITSTQRGVDKNPLNLVRMGLAEMLFPKAKIVLALRHPCDVVLSCYMQNFRAQAFAVTFATIESTAQMYDQVFSYWLKLQAHLSLPVHSVRYEDLVLDAEGQSKNLFHYLDLPWQDDLLNFTERAKRKGAISTPSYASVTENVNQAAIGRWKPYREYFNDQTFAYLMPWIERFGYSLD